ncbi:sulfate transporter [Methyloprofundus sedimenti]|uniref:Sulfate transporter n=2 Tax=Methyloprofundus sedimenti TaxID=1420851 RepID=A0A1V8MBS8_9GAMM|nr:SulP family inorganic anion transporter [Methyloprofundus sedimenti]OQK18773.1 sulfate transporter [Methyloprofundus sedimenti]
MPETGIAGLKKYWHEDLMSGFLVFLIALPLSLGIAMASGLPPMAGILSAIVGGMFVSRINGSFVTIAGPAAGLIVVILDAVQSMGAGDPVAGYRYTLAAIVVAGLLQICLGFFKAGTLSSFFPTSVVHGMLAAIGIIIITKQIHVMVGATPDPGSLFSSMAQIPHSFMSMNGEIALIGITGLLIMIFWSKLQQPILSKIPAPIIVVILGIGLGLYFDLEHMHIYHIPHQLDMLTGHLVHGDQVGPKYLVAISDHFISSFYFPDFSKALTIEFWEAVVSICLVGSLESLLTTVAVDKLDPYKRRSDLDKDIMGIGAGNTLAGLIGGTAMISEVVRSSANINNGAKTGWANFFHGLIMLLFVVLFPQVIHSIPLSALAALLVYTGFKLASPSEFARVLQVGTEQFFMFIVTIIGVLATDLLVGVAIGILVKFVVHIARGVWWKNLFKIYFSINEAEKDKIIVRLDGSAIFSNFLPLKKALDVLPAGKNVTLDLSNAYLVDHTVLEYLHDFMHDYASHGGKCQQIGDAIHTFSDHDLAARIMTHDARKKTHA